VSNEEPRAVIRLKGTPIIPRIFATQATRLSEPVHGLGPTERWENGDIGSFWAHRRKCLLIYHYGDIAWTSREPVSLGCPTVYRHGSNPCQCHGAEKNSTRAPTCLQKTRDHIDECSVLAWRLLGMTLFSKVYPVQTYVVFELTLVPT
jgi:hypothetical protein